MKSVPVATRRLATPAVAAVSARPSKVGRVIPNAPHGWASFASRRIKDNPPYPFYFWTNGAVVSRLSSRVMSASRAAAGCFCWYKIALTSPRIGAVMPRSWHSP